MIPTRLKAKLPGHLSYPVGAAAISGMLAGVPHVEALSITFWDEAVWPGSEFRRLLAGRLPYTVMTAAYRPASRPGLSGSGDMVRTGWFAEKWELSVYPVLAEFRPLANRLLRAEGLPAIVAWLRSSNRAGWVARWQRIDFSFRPTDELLSRRESSGF